MSTSFHEDPFYKRLRDFLNASNAETERGQALVAASLLDEMLGEILKSYLLEGAPSDSLFKGPYAPFATLSAKSGVCRALGLITADEFRDIDLVRKIRNDFAHSLLCSFEDSSVRNRARELKVGMRHLDELEEDHASRIDDPKQRFSLVATSLISALYNRAHHVRSSRIQDREWPA